MTQPKPDLIPVIDAEIISPSQWAAKPKTDEQLMWDELGETSAATAAAICDALACDTRGLLDIAAEITGKSPEAASREFYRWKVRSSALSRIYARACLSRSHVIAHKLYDEVCSEPDAQKARVKMDSLKWLAAKFNRAEFGDDPITVQGPDGGAIKHEHEHRSGVLEELSRRLAKKAKALAREKKETGGEGEYGFENEGGEGDGNNPPLILPSPT